MKALYCILGAVLFSAAYATDLSASHEGEIKKTAQRVWKVCTKHVPHVAWTVTKGLVTVYAAYLATKILPDLAENLKELKDSHGRKVIEQIFERSCEITAFGFLAMKAGDSFLKDLEKL